MTTAPTSRTRPKPLKVFLPLAIARRAARRPDARDLHATWSSREQLQTTKPFCDTNGPGSPTRRAATPAARARPALPSRTVPSGVIAAEKVAELPGIRQVECIGDDATMPVTELVFAAPVPIRDLAYPDLRALCDETWTLTWEGSLSHDTSATRDRWPGRARQPDVGRRGGHAPRSTRRSRSAMPASSTYDIVQLRGCDPSLGDARLPARLHVLRAPESQVAGLGACMLTNEADRLADACKDFLTSLRRYTVGRTRRAASSAAAAQARAAHDAGRRLHRRHPVQDARGLRGAPRRARLNPVDDDAGRTRTPTRASSTPSARRESPGTGKRCIETCTQHRRLHRSARVCQAERAPAWRASSRRSRA